MPHKDPPKLYKFTGPELKVIEGMRHTLKAVKQDPNFEKLSCRLAVERSLANSAEVLL